MLITYRKKFNHQSSNKKLNRSIITYNLKYDYMCLLRSQVMLCIHDYAIFIYMFDGMSMGKHVHKGDKTVTLCFLRYYS